MHPTIEAVTERIRRRSSASRGRYLARCRRAIEAGPARAHLSCGNLAHVTAASGRDKAAIAGQASGNIGIVTAYNDMLSAHQPFERFPELIKKAAREAGGTAQVAGGVPAMCDGVTQGQPGMELSLFSRDVIALAAGVALSHNCFDAAIFLGVCDKIVPGLVIAAATFGHLPAVFAPAGPMTSGLPNDEKSKIRQRFASGEIGRDELLQAEMASYHGPGTCTFYGTANTNQMLMEFMGLHLPGASFVNPNTPLRDALTAEAARRALAITARGNAFTPVSEVLDERAFVNGMVGLNATGGSTNLVLHLVAMARAAGVQIDWQDMAEISGATPLMARVYPNGLADVNHFHAAGGLGYMIGELLEAGLLHDDVMTIAGPGLRRYTEEPRLAPGANGEAQVVWGAGAVESGSREILRPAADPFQPSGGLKLLEGNLGRAVVKVSAVKPENHLVEAPVRVFHDQDAVKAAFKAGELNRDLVVVVRFQGPKANGMPELHSLTPALGVTLDRGHKVALVTDGRMSGASGKVPAAIHLTPEAADGGPIARLRDGDRVRLDAQAGTLEVLVDATEFAAREPARPDLSANHEGIGRELFGAFRAAVGPAETGAAVAV
ncbi:6-phosphogluconate dehydratase [Tistlia consotensis]|uniref:Phosphogluconate dehydratase n=1 Tax=Tistlia consotensis USBA 355 TaxID=560819 RepID=A0A1Y6BV73_9PROT|nr:phosphogluconate dehydratase [Tistlia consotensis]SMF29584.1 6-phosphogluconate dehydratase [Tistlia consotensis USBA 355]SNR91125.1 6-phosphogluconate dehydratase [Tistlia consotensis]